MNMFKGQRVNKYNPDICVSLISPADGRGWFWRQAALPRRIYK